MTQRSALTAWATGGTHAEMFRFVAEDGHRFVIFEDGRTQGFPPGGVVNHIPQLIDRVITQALDRPPFEVVAMRLCRSIWRRLRDTI